MYLLVPFSELDGDPAVDVVRVSNVDIGNFLFMLEQRICRPGGMRLHDHLENS